MDAMFKKAWVMKLLLNIWPPMLFAGIRIKVLNSDYSYARVELRLKSWNKNAVGTHFGGSLYSMTDPFYMLMFKARLGNQYYVWDKSADIDYLKPGKGVITAEFAITDAMMAEVKQQTESGEKYLPSFPVYLKDQQGDLVAVVNRTMYIRRKKRFR